jgi:hypothetical protein
MASIHKTKQRVKRHLAAADDALKRAGDGLDAPDHLGFTDEYIERQLLIAVEACNMGLARIRDFKAQEPADPVEDAYQEG